MNLEEDEYPRVLLEFRRVRRSDGWLLLSFHVGDETRHVDEFLDSAVSLDFHFFPPSVVRQQLTDAGLDVTEVIERQPYAESVAAQTTRAYLFAQKR